MVKFGEKHKGIKNGDRLKLWGGYNEMSEWSKLSKEVIGTVISFIPSQSGKVNETAVVVKLDNELKLKEAKGSFIVLETRYIDQTWEEYGPVHVELCDFKPDSFQFEKRRRGVWIEAASCYDFITEN